MRREQHAVKDALHPSGEWMDGYGYALLAEEWRAALPGVQVGLLHGRLKSAEKEAVMFASRGWQARMRSSRMRFVIASLKPRSRLITSADSRFAAISNVVRVRVAFAQVVHVVRADERQRQVARAAQREAFGMMPQATPT